MKYKTSPFDPDHVHEHFIEPDPDKKITRYVRMCPYCGCVEGPDGDTIILEDNSGTVTCKNCRSIIAYFEVWDMDTQVRIAKSWCCKHPRQFRKGIGILDNRVVNYSKRCILHLEAGKGNHHPDCLCQFSEATWDVIPKGFKPVNKYICFKCLTVVTRRTEDMDRNDVTWSQPFLDSLVRLAGRNMEGLNMPWFEDESSVRALKGQPIKEKPSNKPVPNVDKVESYPLTLEEYLALPYLVNVHRDPGCWGAQVIELNLIIHADSQEDLFAQVQEEMKQYFQDKMSKMDPIPLPAGFEVHDGKVRRTPGTPGAAIPMQYQRYGRMND